MFIEFLPLEILDFIEELAEKYNLDENLKNDPFVKESLSETESVGEKQLIKLLYAKEVFASLIIREIIKDYLNKKIQLNELQKEIQKRLSVEASQAVLIFQDIVNNPFVKKTLEDVSEEIDPAKYIDTNIKGGLSQELQ